MKVNSRELRTVNRNGAMLLGLHLGHGIASRPNLTKETVMCPISPTGTQKAPFVAVPATIKRFLSPRAF